MKITIAKSVLLGPLNQAAKVAGSQTLEILSDILLNVESGFLQIVSGNGDGYISTFIPNSNFKQDSGPGSITINAKKLQEIVAKSGEQITIETEGTTVTIKSGKSKFKLQGNEGDMYPAIPEESGISVVLKASDFKELITKTMYATAQNANTPVLQGVLLQASGYKLTATGCDRHRLAKVELSNLPDAMGAHAVISRNSMDKIKGILKDGEEITLWFGDHGFHVITPDATYFSRVLQDTYPDTSKLIPSVFQAEAKVNTAELREALDRALIIVKEDKTFIAKIESGQDELTISAKIKTSNVEETVTAKCEEWAIKLNCNAKYVLDALKCIDEKTTVIGFNGAMQPFVLWGENNNSELHLILPYRTN